MSNKTVSVIIPSFRDTTEKIEKSADAVRKLLGGRGYETQIIISQNGDGTRHQMPHNVARYLADDKKGLGIALKNGIKEATGTYVYFMPADIPFKFSDLSGMLDLCGTYDFVIGSKLHPHSVYSITPVRKAISMLQSLLIRLLYPAIKIRDVNGTFFGTVKVVRSAMKMVKSDSFFASFELVYYLNKMKCKLAEVPVTYIKKDGATSVRPFDILLYFYHLLSLRFAL